LLSSRMTSADDIPVFIAIIIDDARMRASVQHPLTAIRGEGYEHQRSLLMM
jgi:hypothetical protein